MGFCILGGKENFLRKTISDKLTALGQAIGIGATATQFANAIQSIYDTRYTDGQDSLKTARKLTLSSSQTGSNVDITDNWYTTVDASAVYSAGQTNARQGTATAADVRSSKTFTNSSASGTQGMMPDLSSSNFSTSWSSTTSGQASNFIVTANANGYVAKNTTVNTSAAGTNSTAIATISGTGEQILNITPGIYNKIKVNQSNAYNQGKVDAIGTTVGSGKLHQVGTGTSFTVTVEGIYFATGEQSAPRYSSSLDVLFYKNNTSCGIARHLYDFTYGDFSDGGQTYTARHVDNAMFEYCPVGTVLSCNISVTWYRVYS